MSHPIQTLEAEDARLLLESSPEVPFYFQHFYMNMVYYYQHFLQQVGIVAQMYKNILDQV